MMMMLLLLLLMMLPNFLTPNKLFGQQKLEKHPQALVVKEKAEKADIFAEEIGREKTRVNTEVATNFGDPNLYKYVPYSLKTF